MSAEAPDRAGHEHAVARADVVATWNAASRLTVPRIGRLSLKQMIIAAVLIVVAVIDMTRGFSLIVTSVSTMQSGTGQTTTRQVVSDPPQPVNAAKTVRHSPAKH